ncbi:MAG TPA: class I SAM-dependent methyltransferase, partial [Candidatus Tectomicrobia bacterium]
VSAWLARRGARVIGIDTSAAQLATARRLQREHGLTFTLIHGNAEQVPYPDASFDLAISEYGACLWADPYCWVPEAARILRPGGELIFLVHSALLTLCMPEEDGLAASDRLLRPAFGMYRIEWPGAGREDDALSVRHPAVGTPVAVRRDLEGPAPGRLGPAGPPGASAVMPSLG